MDRTGSGRKTEGGLASGALWIVLVGVALGVGYNAMGLRAGFGVPWKGVDRLVDLEALPAVAADGATGPVSYATDVTDPLAVPGTSPSRLPEIPALGRPVQIEIGALKQYVDAAAALVIDAREPGEYEAGHVPGAINLPYDEAVTDPARLESLDPGSRPIIVYCGGGTCELSLNMAYELNMAGHDKVAVYMGGFPEWESFGYAVE